MTKPKLRSTLLSNCLLRVPVALHMLKGGGFEQTEAMQLGSVAHCLLFEPEKFDLRYEIFTGSKNISVSYKKALETGREPLKDKTYEKAKEMNNVLKEWLEEHETEVRSLLATGKKEESIHYEDEEFIHTIKPDCYNSEFFLDYKTTSLASPDVQTWKTHCIEYYLTIQLGYYYRILKEKGNKVKGAFHLTQSTVAPHFVSAFYFDQNSLEEMGEMVDVAIDSVRKLIEEAKNPINTINYQKPNQEYWYDE